MEAWQRSELTDVTDKVIIYEAFVEGKLEAPKHLARAVHDPYFEPKVRGVPAANDLESVECVYICVQGTRADPTIQGYGQAGGIPRSSVLRSVLASGRSWPGPPLPN